MQGNGVLYRDRQVATWLALCAAVIFCMIVLGGVTRLTESGLSMVEWKPIMGVIPPLNEAQWEETLDKYRQFPQYQKVNKGMSVDEFKAIFMYEYLHRLLGRIIGILFFVPLVYFAWKRKLRPDIAPKLVVLFVLGGLQGLLGWYMVKSGLVDMPRVSQYRLAAHMGLAVLIYGYMLWLVLELLRPRHDMRGPPAVASSLRCYSVALVVLVYLMILSGALVAGTRAGFAWSTWPRMGPDFIPEGLYGMTPAWLAAFEDITTIQFNHRIFAYLLFVLITTFSVLVWRRHPVRPVRLASGFLWLALTAQIVLGISTLLLHVPVPLAAAHQAGAVVLFSAALFTAHTLRRIHDEN